MISPRSFRRGGGEGITLVELACVIAITSILAAFALSAATRTVNAGRVLRAQAEMSALCAALESYRRAFGDYPATSRGDVLLQSLIGRLGPTGAAIESRSFVAIARLTITADRDPFDDPSAEPCDPWGQAYHYAYKSTSPWSNPSFVLYSSGQDRTHADLLAGGRVNRSAAENQDNVWSQP